jgi:lysozyme
MATARLALSVMVTLWATAGCASTVEPEAVGSASQELEVCVSTTLKGVDVSHHNKVVTWSKVKSSGRVFAFARVSDGLKTPDTRFSANWPAMKTAGLVRGAYQFYRPSRDAVEQADFVLRKLAAAGGLKKGDLPPVLDLETTDGLSASSVVAGAKRWLARIESKIGVKPIVYTGNHMAATIGTNFKNYPLWIAHYGVSCPRIPAGWTRWAIWQNSESGSVPGITTGGTDTNFFAGNKTALDALTMQRNTLVDDAEVADLLPLPPEAEKDAAEPGDPSEDAAMGDGFER